MVLINHMVADTGEGASDYLGDLDTTVHQRESAGEICFLGQILLIV